MSKVESTEGEGDIRVELNACGGPTNTLAGLGFGLRVKPSGPGKSDVFCTSVNGAFYELKLCELKHLSDDRSEVTVAESMQRVLQLSSFTDRPIKAVHTVLAAWSNFFGCARVMVWQQNYFSVNLTDFTSRVHEIVIGTTDQIERAKVRACACLYPPARGMGCSPVWKRRMEAPSVALLIQAVFGTWERFMRLISK